MTGPNLSVALTFAGVSLDYVFSVDGNTGLDQSYPTCAVSVPVKPATGNEGDELTVVAGYVGSHVVDRGTYRVMRFRQTDNPPTVELMGAGTLARAEQHVNDAADPFADDYGDVDLFPDPLAPTFPSILAAGVTSTGKNIVMAMLDRVAAAHPELVYTAANLDDAGVELGLEALDPFVWKVGQSALDYIREIDRLEGMRTYQTVDGTIYRRLIVGHPDSTPDFTLDAANTLTGATGDRNDEETRNWLRATGFDYGDGSGACVYTLTSSNPLQAIGEANIAPFNHDMIEREDEANDPGNGYSCEQIANREIFNVNKEFVRSSVPVYIDDVLGPGQTHLVDLLAHIAVGEPMWCQGLAWRIDTQDGWTQTPTHTGGGLQGAYTRPPV